MQKATIRSRRQRKSSFNPLREEDKKMWVGLYSELLSLQDDLKGFSSPEEVRYEALGLVLKRVYNRTYRFCGQLIEKENPSKWFLYVDYCKEELKVPSAVKAARAGPFSLCLRTLETKHRKNMEKRADLDDEQKEFLKRYLLINSGNRYTYSKAMSVIYAAQIKPKGFDSLFEDKNLTEISKYEREHSNLECLPTCVIKYSKYLRSNFQDKLKMKEYVDNRLELFREAVRLSSTQFNPPHR